MRFFLLPSLLLISCASGFGQEQDRKLMDRVLKPDMERRSTLDGKAFEMSSNLGTRTSSDAQVSYAEAKAAYTKDFAFTRSFFGLKNPWFGKKVYEGKDESSFAVGEAYGSERQFEVRKAEAVSFVDDTKTANFGSPVVPVRQIQPEGAAQGAMDQITEKASKEMTIDEVRELLNKSR